MNERGGWVRYLLYGVDVGRLEARGALRGYRRGVARWEREEIVRETILHIHKVAQLVVIDAQTHSVRSAGRLLLRASR